MIYLAGPITGCDYAGAVDWREDFAAQLPGIKCLSPMRGKAFLSKEQCLGVHDNHVLSAQRGIYCRDSFDVHRVDIVLANLLGTKIVSIGTMFELAWASRNDTPLIVIMEAEGNIHDHPFVREAADFRVETIKDAIDLIKVILG